MTDFTRYIRTPFQVQATQITEENMVEIADLLVSRVETGPGRRDKEETYIVVNRRIVPTVTRAYVGYWVTKMGDNFRCYSPIVFKQQFMPMPDVQPVSFDFADKPTQNISDPLYVDPPKDLEVVKDDCAV